MHWVMMLWQVPSVSSQFCVDEQVVPATHAPPVQETVSFMLAPLQAVAPGELHWQPSFSAVALQA
jgi:hypothetical protein